MSFLFRDLPEWAGDRLTVVTDVQLDLRDRVRVLITGRLSVRTSTDVEHALGRFVTEARVTVPKLRRFGRWWWQTPANLGMVEAGVPDASA